MSYCPQKQPKTTWLHIDDAALHAASLTPNDAPKQLWWGHKKTNKQQLCLIAGNTNIILSLSCLNQRIVVR